ncbi:MAG: isoprenylcysteine carboxylmethyltransferase family protein [Candidatus Dormibacteraceae bacterium]
MPVWYLGVLVLVGAQRVRELALSSANTRGQGGRPSAPATYPLIVAVHVALFVLPLVEIRLSARRPRPAPAAGWLVLLGGATALRWWAIRTLGKSWNVRAVVADDLEPVTGGPYRWIRHPNYLALLIEFVALPMAGGARISALILSALNAAALADRIRAEDAQLARSARYRRAFAGRARLIPGIY